MKTFAYITTMVGIIVLLAFLLSYPMMLLWNACLVPAVDGIHEVTWAQMLGITVLCALLFKPNTSSK